MKKLLTSALVLVMLLGMFINTPKASALSSDSLDGSNILKAEFLPSSYESDYKNLSYSTSAKDQNPYGLCWAFSAIACAEADAIKNHGADKNTLDLSEWHLAYFAFNGARTDTGDFVYMEGDVAYYDIGGYDILAPMTLSNWIGLANESDADYDTLVRNPYAKLDESSIDLSEYKLKSAVTYDIRTEPEKIKEAIMTYGAVSVSYYGDEYYMNDSTFAHYCANYSKGADHSVTIVGWDDNYSRNNFSFSMRPISNGAWLVKNSWSDDWGLDGYFWISYEDVTLEGGTVYDVVPADEYDNLYSHDGGSSFKYLPGKEDSSVANVFCAKGDELLTSVSIGTFASEPTDYTLQIFTNPPGEFDAQAGFDFDRTPIHTQSGSLLYGINCIDLDNGGIELVSGEYFALVFTTAADLMVDSSAKIDLGEGTNLVSESKVSANQSYYRESNGEWIDVYDSVDWNLRIKAFTKDSSKEMLRIIDTPSLSALNYGDTLSQIALTGGKVVDYYSGEVVHGKWYFANSDQIPENNEKVALRFYPDDRSKYSSVFTNVTVSVLPSAPAIEIIMLINGDRSDGIYSVGDYVVIDFLFTGVGEPSSDVLGRYTLYYVIEGTDERVVINGRSFTVPEEADGKRIFIILEYEGYRDRYSPATFETVMGVNTDPYSDSYATDFIDGEVMVIFGILITALAFVSSAIVSIVVSVALPTITVTGIVIIIIIIVKTVKKRRSNR